MSGTFASWWNPFVLLAAFAIFLTLPVAKAYSAADAATKKVFAEVFVLYQKKAYQPALEKLNEIKQNDRAVTAERAYWRGLLHARLLKMDEAINYYKKAGRYGFNKPEYFYEYGQALYATQRLREARDKFVEAIKYKYKRAVSAYYSGYISQLLEEYKKAKYFYSRTLMLEDEEAKKIAQPVLLQIAEMEFEEAEWVYEKRVQSIDIEEMKVEREEEFAAYVHKYIIPTYEKARDFNEDSDAGKQASKRIAEISRTYRKQVPRMRNGTPIPRKKGQIKYTSEIGHDTNVISRADGTTTAITNKSSAIWKNSFYSRAQFEWNKTISFSPVLSMYYTRHFKRNDPEIYRFDTISISPSLKNKFEHTLGEKRSTFLFNADLNYTTRDRERNKQQKFFTSYAKVTLAERIMIWESMGNTTFEFNSKFFRSATINRNAVTNELKLKQNIKYAGKRNLQLSFYVNRRRARNDLNDQQTANLGINTAFNDLIWRWDLKPSVTLTLTDPLKQKAARGNEITLKPSIEFARKIIEHLDFSAKWDYTRTWSRDEVNYELSRHIFTMGLSVSN